MAQSTAAGNGATAAVPEVVVRIDNESDPFATIVTVEYGDLLGELLDTVRGGDVILEALQTCGMMQHWC